MVIPRHSFPVLLRVYVARGCADKKKKKKAEEGRTDRAETAGKGHKKECEAQNVKREVTD